MDIPLHRTTGDLLIADNRALFVKGRNRDEQESIPVECVPLVTATRCQKRGRRPPSFWRPPFTEFSIHRDPIFTETLFYRDPNSQRHPLQRPLSQRYPFTRTPLSQRLLLRRAHPLERPLLSQRPIFTEFPFTRDSFCKDECSCLWQSSF